MNLMKYLYWYRKNIKKILKLSNKLRHKERINSMKQIEHYLLSLPQLRQH